MQNQQPPARRVLKACRARASRPVTPERPAGRFAAVPLCEGGARSGTALGRRAQLRRPRALAGHHVAAVVERAALQGQTPAPDAAVQVVPQPDQRVDPRMSVPA